MGRPVCTIELTEAERAGLEGLARRRRTAQGLAMRARIVLLCAEGLSNQSVAAQVLGISRGTLRKKLKEHGLGTT